MRHNSARRGHPAILEDAMSFSVRLTGGYRPGYDPQAVHDSLAKLFRQDAARVAQLIAAGATIKRGVDAPTAERFRQAIETAGAGCAIDEEDTHLAIDVPAPAVAVTAAPDEEATIWEGGPSPAAYAGPIALGALLLPAFGIGLLVWLGVWIAWKSARYKLTNQRLFVRSGFIARKVQELELYRVTDVAFSQGLVERSFGIGTVSVVANDPTTPRLAMPGIADPETVKETIRTAYRRARRAEGVRVGERMVE
jgi:membrane protein YdbS with pleckstrin-like domain